MNKIGHRCNMGYLYNMCQMYNLGQMYNVGVIYIYICNIGYMSIRVV